MQKIVPNCEVITAMVTPFNEDLEIDYNKVSELALYLCENGSDGLLIAGTTGESPTLTHEEEYELMFCTKAAVGNEAKIIMGAGSNCTKTAVESAQKAQENGADMILSVVPYYNKPSQEGIYQHFATVAKNVDLPIILYNIPGRTGVNMQPQTVINLANDFENIVALKQSCSDLDLLSEIINNCPENFSVFSGDDSLTLPMLSIGAKGVISVASHIVGKQIKEMISSFKNNNSENALKIHKNLFPLFKKLFMLPNPVPVKEALSRMGKIERNVRLPLVEMTMSQQCEFYNILEKYI